jgi:hypothetical protein
MPGLGNVCNGILVHIRGDSVEEGAVEEHPAALVCLAPLEQVEQVYH